MPIDSTHEPAVLIGPYKTSEEAAVIALWEACGLTRTWNDPAKDIARKLTTQPKLFFVARLGQSIIGSVMAGYDGHRGWVNYLAVAPNMQRRGIGQQLMARVEQALADLGCPKLNLQIRATNQPAAAFYQALGYQTDEVISMGKRLIEDR